MLTVARASHLPRRSIKSLPPWEDGRAPTHLAADVTLLSRLGALLLRRRLLEPLDRTVSAVEAISRGALDTGMPEASTAELTRLSAAVSQMADHLLPNQRLLTENIRSLNDTNRQLTEARDAMVRAETMASVGRLAAGVAHEVGNPLGAIIGYLALLGRKQEGPQQELVKAAEREASRIDRIIRGLLDYARPREAVAQPVAVDLVVRDTVELLHTQGMLRRIAFESVPAATPPVVRGDPYQLQQVLVNLLVNAADALADVPEPCIRLTVCERAVKPTPPGVHIRRRDDPPGIDYSHRRRLAQSWRWHTRDPETDSGRVVEIAIADNGPGIPGDLLDQIFEPFVTTKEPGKGTGLGLALSAQLMEGMGGVVQAENAPAGGAIFRVVMPAFSTPTDTA
ncbi:MAG: HAMP domain-containing protein [Gemmatimonadetes bacterium]|nr:HAMP domain-containing protein [Gemmatimonadota bacterium]